MPIDPSTVTWDSGPLEKGTLDPTKPVAMVKNSDGSTSTVRTMSFGEDGREILIPTVHPEGRIMEPEEAIDYYHKTGDHFGKFDTVEDADKYAQSLHEDHAKKFVDKINPADVKWDVPAPVGSFADNVRPEAFPESKPQSTMALSQGQPTPQPRKFGVTDNIAGAVAEPLMQMGSGAIAAPLSNLAGLGAIAVPDVNPQQVKQSVQTALTYEPQTPAGKAVSQYNPVSLIGQGVSEGVAAPARKYIQGDADTTSLRGMAGRGVEEAINQAPAVLGASISKAPISSANEALLAKQAKLNAPKDAIRDASQSAGIITPIEGDSLLAGIAGLNKSNKAIAAGNAADFRRITADSLPGWEKNVPLTPDELGSYISAQGKAYRAVAEAGDDLSHQISVPQGDSKILAPNGRPIPLPPKLTTKSGFALDDAFKGSIKEMGHEISSQLEELPQTFKALGPSLELVGEYAGKDVINSRTTIQAIKKLRSDANLDFKSDDTVRISTGFTRKAIAEQLDDLVERNLEKAGNKELLDQYKQARVNIKKAYDIKSAVDPVGNVDIRKFYLISKKNPGLLKDNLKLLADYAGTFPEGAQKVGSGSQLIGPWDWLIAGGAVASKHPLVGAAELIGRAGVPLAAQKGMLQKKTPSYAPPGARIMPPFVGESTTEEATRR